MIIPKLLVLSDIMRGQAFQIDNSPYTIGRVAADSVDLVVSDKSLSSKHAVILNKDDNYYIKDLKSTNGTSLDGSRLVAEKASLLKAGAIIQLGNIEFLFDIKSDTSIELQTGIDLTNIVGDIDEELLTSISPLECTEHEKKKSKNIIRVLLFLFFIIAVILILLTFKKYL